MGNLNISLKDTSLIIATYNEEESLPFVLHEIKEYDFGEIIIVDGHSTDNTKLVAQSYGATFIQQDKKGWGSAVLQGISASSLEYITYMDGDGSYNPTAILEMKSLIKDNDAVFSSRYKGGAKSPDDTFIRGIGNKLFTFLVRLLFKCKISDALFFYPLFRREILEKIDLRSSDFTLCLELPAVVHSNKLRYTEILSIERERFAGVTKVNAFFDGLKILRGMLSLRFLI